MWQVYREVQIRYACFSRFWSSKKKWILHFMRYTSTTDTAGRHPTGMNSLSVISVKNMACRCRFFGGSGINGKKEETISGGSRAGDPQGIV